MIIMNKPQIPLVLAIAIILVIGGAVSPMAYAQQPQKSIIKHTEDFTGETIQVFNQLFKDCPAGIILYKLNGELVVVCMIDSVHGKLVDHQGQIINIDVHLDDNDDHKSNHHDNDNHEGPDQDCLFNASLPKCDPDSDGNCPDDFNLNEDENCFPDHSDTGCPEGTHGVDDDETGQCYDNDEHDCPDGMVLREDGKSCGYKDDLCKEGSSTNPNCSVEEEQEVVVEEEQEVIQPIAPLSDTIAEVTAEDAVDDSGVETTTTTEEDDISSNNDDDTNRLSEEETVEESDNEEGEVSDNEEDNN